MARRHAADADAGFVEPYARLFERQGAAVGRRCVSGTSLPFEHHAAVRKDAGVNGVELLRTCQVVAG